MARISSPSPAALSRRGFVAVIAGATATFGFPHFALAAIELTAPDGTSTPAPGPQFEPSIWFSIDGHGIATINIIRAEMGQHVGTALARMLADELEIGFDQVRIVHVDSDPKWGVMVTGGSWSVTQTWPIFRPAGAAGRITLIEAGARLMSVRPARCIARDGKVICGTKTISYGDIVRRGDLTRRFSAAELAALPLKTASEMRLIGKDSPSRDIPAKTNGTAIYGIDAKIDGMVYACPILPPTRNGSIVRGLDDSAAKTLKGYVQSLIIADPTATVPGWVLVIASSFPAAMRAAKLVKVEYTPGPGANISESDILDHATALIADEKSGAWLETGTADTQAAFAAAASTLEQTYTTSTVLHFQLEPLNALVFEKDGVFEIHTGNQWQSLILPILAKALGVTPEKIVMRTYLLGGGFGRRLNGDYIVPAALAAKLLGKPVKMVMPRAEDVRFDSPRSPSVQKLRMAFDHEFHVSAMEHHAAAGWPTQVMAPFFMPKASNGVPYDPFSIAGADHWYDVGAQKVRAISNDLANSTFRPGWLRSVGPGWTNWASESFIDEAAHHVNMDPLAFRLALLTGAGRNGGSAPTAVGGAHRLAAVLQTLAARADWAAQLPPDSGLGIACSFGQERDLPTWIACAARVHVDRATGQVTVQKLTLVADAGTIVDPGGALAQTQGAALWGLSMALHEGSGFENGQVKDTNLDTYTPLRINQVPELDISFLPSTEAPVGLGEPGTTVVAPAIANAIFKAVGARVRHLPITAESVKAALG